MKKRFLFGMVLTGCAPSRNYRGERTNNVTPLQTVEFQGATRAAISAEALRNAFREMLTAKGLPVNRRRLLDQNQPAVEYSSYPDPNTFADDFIFGYMVADKKAVKVMKNPHRRDSLFQVNLALATEPFAGDEMFTVSPLSAGGSPWKSATTSALLHSQVSVTAFQYPFSLPLEPFYEAGKEAWGRAMLESVGELSEVAGNQARSFFDMSPLSLVIRLTNRLAPGFELYGFERDGQWKVLPHLLAGDFPGEEFWLGGDIVRNLSADDRQTLKEAGVHLYTSLEKMNKDLVDEVFPVAE